MWYLTKNQSHADKAITIMDSWSNKIKIVDPNCEIGHSTDYQSDMN